MTIVHILCLVALGVAALAVFLWVRTKPGDLI